ncbi:MAG TPA: hypothetical protein VGB37_03180 [Candidatus Lokiarchaeia archaeon]
MQEEIEKSVLGVVEGIPVIIINNDDEMKQANEFLQKLKAQKKYIVDFFKEPKEVANKAHKTLTQREKALVEEVDKKIKAVTAPMITYDAKKESERLKKQQEMEEAIKKENEKILKAAEKKIADLLAKSGDIQNQLEVVKERIKTAQGQELSLLISQKATLEAQIGKLSQKATIQADKVEIASQEIILNVPVSKIDGIKEKISMVVEIVDPMSLIINIAEGDIPITVLCNDPFNKIELKRLLESGIKIIGAKLIQKKSY